MSVFLAVAAGLLISGLAVDVLITVFHPHGHGGPLTRTLNRAVRRSTTLLAAGRRPDVRSKLLAFCGPVLAPLTIVVWGLWLVLGFAFLYSIPGALTRAPGGVAASHVFFDALYYSGYVSTTLGLGDVIAIAPWARFATILQAVFGFALIAIVVTYVLSIYRELLAAHTLALEICLLATIDSDSGGLARWDRTIVPERLRATEAHGQYPILHYFRPRDPARCLVLQGAPVFRDTSPGDESGQAEVTDLALATVRHFFLGLHSCLPRRLRCSTSDIARVDLERVVDKLLEYNGYASLTPTPSPIDT